MLLKKRHAVRGETSQHANSQSVYAKVWNRRFYWPWKKKQIPNRGSEKKSPVSSIFALALLTNGCGLPVLWFCPVYLLNLHAFYFWAIIVSRAGCKVGSWRATSSLPSSFSLNFWAWGLAFFVMGTVGTRLLQGKCQPPSGFELWSAENNLIFQSAK